MDPISAGLGILGTGIQLWSSFSAAHKASENAAAVAKENIHIASDEQAINDQKRQQMQLEAGRMQLQQFRNIQRQRALGIAAATNQGAQYGSGLAGGIAQTQGEGNTNLLGINQNLQIGQTIFGINNDISQSKMHLAQLNRDNAQDQANAQAWNSLGGSLVKNSGTIGGLSQDAYAGASRAFALFSPGALSGGLA